LLFLKEIIMFTDPYYYKSYAEWLASPDIFERESSSGFIKILNSLDRDIVAAEVGVAFGTNMFHMMEKVPRITKYYAVDQWDEYKDYADDCPWGHMDGKMMQSVGETFLNKLNSPDNKNKDKVVLIKKPSETGHHFIENDSLDWIFIDENIDVARILPFPTEDQLSSEVALPSSCHPSDHLSLVVDLKFKI
jgi:hypothetical protein